MQLTRTGFKEATDVAGGLTDALLILDQRDAHVTLAELAETNAGRYGDLGLFDQQGGEFGEGHVRIALVENEQRIRQAARNIRRFLETGPSKLHNVVPLATRR